MGNSYNPRGFGDVSHYREYKGSLVTDAAIRKHGFRPHSPTESGWGTLELYEAAVVVSDDVSLLVVP